MVAMNTAQLVQAALDLVGWEAPPSDTRVGHPGTRISHVLIGMDLDVGDLFMARQLGYHGVIAYQRHGEHDPARFPLAALRDRPDRLPSAARLLDLPLALIRSPFDELGRRRLQAAIDDVLDSNPGATLGDLRAALRAVPPLGAAPFYCLPEAAWEEFAGKTIVVGSASLAESALTPAAIRAADTLCCRSLAPEAGRARAAGELPPRLLLLGEDPAAAVGILPYITHLREQGIEVTAYSGIPG